MRIIGKIFSLSIVICKTECKIPPTNFKGVEETIYRIPYHKEELKNDINNLIESSDKVTIIALELNEFEITELLVNKLTKDNNFKVEIFLNGNVYFDRS